MDDAQKEINRLKAETAADELRKQKLIEAEKEISRLKAELAGQMQYRQKLIAADCDQPTTDNHFVRRRAGC